MVKSCIICGMVRTANVSVFRFPKKALVRKKWIDFCGITADKVSEYTCLCIKHFSSTVVRSCSGMRRLTANAVPTLLGDTTYQEQSVVRQHTCLLCGTSNDSRLYFKFPSNVKKRKEWLRRCGKSPKTKGFIYLCECHFSVSDIIHKRHASGKNRLRPNSVPKLHTSSLIPQLVDEDNTVDNVCVIYPEMYVECIEKLQSSTSSDEAPTVQLVDEDNKVDNLDEECNTFRNVSIEEVQSPISTYDEAPTIQLVDEDNTVGNLDKECNRFGNVSIEEVLGNVSNEEVQSPISTYDEAPTIQLVDEDNTADNLDKECNTFGNVSIEEVQSPMSTYDEDPNEQCDCLKQPRLNFSNVIFEQEVHKNVGMSNANYSTKPARRFYEPRYISEICTSDFEIPERATRILKFVQETDKRKNKKIQSLQAQKRKLEKRVILLKRMVADIKKGKYEA